MSPLYDQRSTSSSARRAGGRHPSTSSRPPGVSFPRASSLDHSPPTSGRWIRRPPHRRDGQSLGPARGSVGLMTLYFFIVQGSQGVGISEYATSRVFLRPFRGKAAGAAWRMGAGLGRSMSRRRRRGQSPPSDPLLGPPSPELGEGKALRVGAECCGILIPLLNKQGITT